MHVLKLRSNDTEQAFGAHGALAGLVKSARHSWCRYATTLIHNCMCCYLVQNGILGRRLFRHCASYADNTCRLWSLSKYRCFQDRIYTTRDACGHEQSGPIHDRSRPSTNEQRAVVAKEQESEMGHLVSPLKLETHLGHKYLAAERLPNFVALAHTSSVALLSVP